MRGAPTTSFGDSGARSASAISCAFWLTLPCLVRTVLHASDMLFCLERPACGAGDQLTPRFGDEKLPFSPRAPDPRNLSCGTIGCAVAPLVYATLVGLVTNAPAGPVAAASDVSIWSGNFSITSEMVVAREGVKEDRDSRHRVRDTIKWLSYRICVGPFCCGGGVTQSLYHVFV